MRVGLLVLELPFALADGNLSIDPAKVISGVIGGIGFLGAGVLFREGDAVRGAGLLNVRVKSQANI